MKHWNVLLTVVLLYVWYVEVRKKVLTLCVICRGQKESSYFMCGM